MTGTVDEVPSPERLTVVKPPEALWRIETVAVEVKENVVESGLNLTWILQLAPTGTLLQLLVCSNSFAFVPDNDIWLTVKVSEPVLLNAIVCGSLVVP